MKENIRHIGKLQKCPPIDYSCDNLHVTEWKNTFDMSHISIRNIAQKPSCSPHIRKRYITSTSKSLDLLRQNLQAAITKDIHTVIRGYLDKFFSPAVENIRTNSGNGSVTEDHVSEVCCNILEEAKQYYSKIKPNSDSSPNEDVLVGKTESKIRSQIINKKRVSSEFCHSSHVVKRPRILAPITVPISKLDPLRINSKSLFILASRAHKVLGLTGVRGRLFIQHPELLRYTADQEDRDWLSSHNVPTICLPTYLLVMEDVREIVNREEYRSNPNIMLSELKGFEVAEFILVKIQNHMSELRRLMTSTFTSAANETSYYLTITQPTTEVSLGDTLNITPSDGSTSSTATQSSLNSSSISSLFNLKPSIKLESKLTNNSESNSSPSLAETHSTLTALLSTPGGSSSQIT